MKLSHPLIGAAALALASFALPAGADTSTNLTSTSTNTASVTTNTVASDLGLSGMWLALYKFYESSGIDHATNWAVAPYLTYAPKAADKVGGGVLAVYNVPQLTDTNLGSVGAAIGADWLGSWSLISGNVTITAETHPLKSVSWLSFLPDSLRNVQAEPFAIAGVGTPLSGGTSSAATLWDLGYDVKFGHWLGGQFGTGVSWGEWMNAGQESGHRYHIFLEYRYGF